MEKETDKIDLRKYFAALKRGKWWLISIFTVIMALAVTYAVIKMPQFVSNSVILVENDTSNGSGMSGMGVVMRSFSLGGFGKKAVDNEILIMQSHALKKEMVCRLGLNRTYLERNGLAKQILYKNSPVIVDAPSALFDTLQVGFKIKVELHNGKADIKATKGMFDPVLAEKKDVELPCSLETPYGTFQILKSTTYNPDESRTINVIVQGDHLAAHGFGPKKLSINYMSKKADAVQMTILDVSKERGCDILNTLMTLYNERRKERREETAAAEVAFLDERIAQLGTQLSESEQKVVDFKKDNNIVDIGAEVSYLVGRDKNADIETVKMNVEKTLLEEILKQLKDPSKKYSLIPMAETLGDGGAVSVISNYNDLVMRRMRVAKSAKEDNVVLKNLNEQIDALHTAAIENVERTLEKLEVKYSSVVTEKNKHRGRLTNLPQYEQEYIDLKRDRELKNSLYVFLLEKRESAMLKLNSSQELGFVFEPAYSSLEPDNTKKHLIVGLGGTFGLILGVCVALWFGFKKAKKKNEDEEQ